MSKENRLGEKAPKYLFYFSLLVTMFLGGMAIERYHVPPYDAIHEASRNLKRLTNIGKWDHLVYARTPNAQEQTTVRDGAAKGYRVISGAFPKRAVLHGAVLLDPEGHEVHYWPIVYDRLDPKGPGAWHVSL